MTYRIPASTFITIALLATSSFATARPSTLINTNLQDDARGIGVSSQGDLTAICWNEGGGTNQVFVATSDGRGLSWSSGVRVDNDGFTKTSQVDSVFVSGSNIYVIWEANTGLFFNRSTDNGATFGTPIPLDIGPGTVTDWRVAYSADPGGDHIYVISSTAVADEDLYLTASHDDGATFSLAALVPSVGITGDVDTLAVAADGLTVHVAWDDNRSGRDSVYYQKSTDGGATFLPTDVSLGDNVSVEDSQDPLNIASSGSTVAVMWNEEPGGSGSEVIVANVSSDGGTTFAGSVTVGSYTSGVDDTDEGDIGIDPLTGTIIVVWEDDRTGSDQAYAATSTDGGLTFSGDTSVSANGAEKPTIHPGLLGHAAILWESTGNPRTVESSLSRDGGVTWSSSMPVSDNPGFADFVTGGYNPLYHNFIAGWASLDASNLQLFAGGFRPQTLTPVGSFTPGGQVSFSVSEFPSGESGFTFGILISGTPGNFLLPLGDGRNTGLASDGFLQRSTAQIPGLLSGSIDSTGMGSTPTFSIPGNVQPGTQLHCVAVSFMTGGGSPVIGSLTDRVLVTIQ